MTDPDLERLAKQSGLYISAELRIFAALIEAHERERCLEACHVVSMQQRAIGRSLADAWDAPEMLRADGADLCAAAIRAPKDDPA